MRNGILAWRRIAFTLGSLLLGWVPWIIKSILEDRFDNWANSWLDKHGTPKVVATVITWLAVNPIYLTLAIPLAVIGWGLVQMHRRNRTIPHESPRMPATLSPEALELLQIAQREGKLSFHEMPERSEIWGVVSNERLYANIHDPQVRLRYLGALRELERAGKLRGQGEFGDRYIVPLEVHGHPSAPAMASISVVLKQIQFMDMPGRSTRVFAIVDVRNGGPATVVRDWQLQVPGYPGARAIHRHFIHSEKDSRKIDNLSDEPPASGAHRTGTLTFVLEGVSKEEAQCLRQAMRLSFENANRDRLWADDNEDHVNQSGREEVGRPQPSQAQIQLLDQLEDTLNDIQQNRLLAIYGCFNISDWWNSRDRARTRVVLNAASAGEILPQSTGEILPLPSRAGMAIPVVASGEPGRSEGPELELRALED